MVPKKENQVLTVGEGSYKYEKVSGQNKSCGVGLELEVSV